MVMGYFVLGQSTARLTQEEQDGLLKSPLTPTVSVLAPAYNESATVRESVKALLKLRYPSFEVIVVNDGSRDETLKILIEEFRLYKSGRVASGTLPTKPVRAIYESRDPIRLVVVDKENGGKADSLNAGLNVARSTLVAAIDSDSLLEPNALLHVAFPFLEDPERTIATGGIVRVINGCEVSQGQVTRVATPHSLLACFQAVEYLRAFLGGRVAFSFMNCLLIISGAFGLFRRDAAIAAGGFSTSTVGEDMELVMRLHILSREKGEDYRIAFVPEPVCWTEVPESWKTLQRQRNRWQRGTVECLRAHRHIFLNPRFGVLGILGYPYFLLFEMCGPIIELLGYIMTLSGLVFGIIAPSVAILFLIVSILFGIMLSVGAVMLEELTTRHYPDWRDVLRLFLAAILENFGYRQLLTIWRTKGVIDAFRGKQGWGAMERRGFNSPPK
jgi:cellulose synthase/poly-beta-1,6-N-acetylglucosamine synthase-like glycosyltransferase